MSLFSRRNACRVWSWSAAALGLAWMASAGAQQAPSTGEGQATEQLEEIVVTSAKRSASVLETPLSVTAISGADIQARGPTDFNSLIQTVPGLASFDQGPGPGGSNRRSVNVSVSAMTLPPSVPVRRPTACGLSA